MLKWSAVDSSHRGELPALREWPDQLVLLVELAALPIGGRSPEPRDCTDLERLFTQEEDS